MANKLRQSDADHYTVEIGSRGQLVLPEAVREKLSLGAGDRVVLSVESDGSMRLVSLREQIRKTKGLYKDLAPGRDLAEELIRERRAEARRGE
jgi:AbrB family looped-hinge helix DNA binding protein